MMRAAEDLLQELAALDESHRIEAKQARQIDRSIMETVCAFANEPGLGGGYLLLGVSRDPQDSFTSAYRIDGINDPDKLQSDFASQCASVFNRPIRPRLAVEELHGKTVVVAFVSEAAPTEKPIFLQNLGLPRGAYRRVGPTDQEGTEDDLVALYAGHQLDTFDAALLPDADLEDIDPVALDDYRQLRRAINPDAEELGWSNDDLLRALGCAKRDGEQLKPTVAGIVLFGSVMALRRCFPMMRIDYIRVPGRQWVENPDHRFDTLEIRAPLFTAIRRATNTVRDELIQSFSLPEGALVREDEPTLPLRVIREAIVNAVMHRSYRIHGAIQIIRSNSHQADQDSHQADQDSHQADQDSHQLLASIPPQLVARIPPVGSKPRRDILRALIVDLCRWHALSARELATILHGREQKPLVRDYLTPMVRDGRLAYTIPEMEKHPDQRYTVPAEVTEGGETT